MKLFLTNEIEKLWRNRDPFQEIFRIKGTVVRSVKNRSTLRIKLGQKSYFIKIHRGTSWREIFKNLFMLKKPVLGAENEYHAIRRLEEIGIPSTPICGFGSKGKNPTKKKSFIITRDLGNLPTLEDLTSEWKQNPPDFEFKKTLIEKIAVISNRIHDHGLNHRDYYICHFLISGTDVSPAESPPDAVKIHLIDLHRAQLRNKTPYRWMVKDIAGLWFSAMDAGLNRKDLFRFIKLYSGKPLKQTLKEEKKFYRDISRQAGKLYRKVHRREPSCHFNSQVRLAADEKQATL